MEKRVIIGIGNYTMTDDAVGLQVIDSILDNHLDVDFEAVTLGTGGFRLLSFFNPSIERILIIDAVHMDAPPGTFQVLNPDEIISRKKLDGFSTHEADVLHIITIARKAKQHVPPLRIIAVQPYSLEEGYTLSPILNKKLLDIRQKSIEVIHQEW